MTAHYAMTASSISALALANKLQRLQEQEDLQTTLGISLAEYLRRYCVLDIRLAELSGKTTALKELAKEGDVIITSYPEQFWGSKAKVLTPDQALGITSRGDRVVYENIYVDEFNLLNMKLSVLIARFGKRATQTFLLLSSPVDDAEQAQDVQETDHINISFPLVRRKYFGRDQKPRLTRVSNGRSVIIELSEQEIDADNANQVMVTLSREIVSTLSGTGVVGDISKDVLLTFRHPVTQDGPGRYSLSYIPNLSAFFPTSPEGDICFLHLPSFSPGIQDSLGMFIGAPVNGGVGSFSIPTHE